MSGTDEIILIICVCQGKKIGKCICVCMYFKLASNYEVFFFICKGFKADDIKIN